MNPLGPESFFNCKEPRAIVDIRPAKAFAKGSFREAIHLPYQKAEKLLASLSQKGFERPIHLVDAYGTIEEILPPSLPYSYLKGGYAAFQQWRNQAFEQTQRMVIVGGYTGSGKTKFLNTLRAAGFQVMDLEALAGHRGSAFGYPVKGEQRPSECFQNSLLENWLLLNRSAPLWLEEKGPFLGKASIPVPIYDAMKAAPLIHLEVPFHRRLAHLLGEYDHLHGTPFRSALEQLEKRMGADQHAEALHYHDSGQREQCFALLLKYYDRAYSQRRQRYWRGLTIRVPHDPDTPETTIDRIFQLTDIL